MRDFCSVRLIKYIHTMKFVCLFVFLSDRKKMVLAEIKQHWPTYGKIPSFRAHHVEENMKLNEFIKRLTEGKASAKYTFPECGFGANAIREMVMTHMRERRRKMKDTGIIKGQATPTDTSTDSNGDTESVESGSSGDLSPPSTKKVKEYADYFHPGQFTVISYIQRPSFHRTSRQKMIFKVTHPLEAFVTCTEDGQSII